MTSYRQEKEMQPSLWYNQDCGTATSYKTVPYGGQHSSPMDTLKMTHMADSGYASPLLENASSGPYGTYYGPGGVKYSASTGTYPGARSSISITKIPDNQQFFRSQEYEDSVPLDGSAENFARNAYSSQTLPVQRGSSSYRSMVVTQVTPEVQEPRSSQIIDPVYPQSDGAHPIERHISIQMHPRSPLPQGASSRLVYSAQPPALGIVRSKPFNPATPPRPDENASYPPTHQLPPHIQMKMVRGGSGLQDPRPYQLKPTMDPVRGIERATPLGLNSLYDSGKEAEVDALTDLLMQNMQVAGDPDFFGMCARCGRSIMGENTGCSALDQLFHIDCFRCISCNLGLRGHPFYAMEGKPYCENCFMATLEKCSTCSKPITDRMLRATGKPYHPGCFNCVVCGKNLDSVAFTVDATSQIHCIEDFHRKFAPRCCVCSQPIMPRPGKEETIRIVALDRSFHFECYRCEDCGMLLSSESEGRGCYPLDDHVLCKVCNAKRIQSLTSKMTTEL